MDPLSVTAGVVGILAAAGQLIQILNQLGSAVKDASTDTQAAATELANITIVVQGLQTYVMGRIPVAPQRLQLITVEHITATLTGCILTCSDLDKTLKSLHVDTGLTAWDKAKWFLKKDHVVELVQRLQTHKATFTMMLNIIQCSSMSVAEQNMDQLCDKVNELLRSNEELSLRLRNIESGQNASRILPSTRRTNSASSTSSSPRNSPKPSGSPIRLPPNPRSEPLAVVVDEATPYRSHFEEILHRTRVYRHVQSDSYEPSLVSDARSTLALSICSSLTLGDISNISVYALPIYSAELSNSSCYDLPSGSDDSTTTISPLSPAKSENATSTKKSNSLWRAFKRKPRKPQISDPQSTNSPSRVFGVHIHTSVRYANVAISLLDENGKSYIYGYVPIVVAKCGVFLKEKATSTEFIFETGGSPIKIKAVQSIFEMPDRYGKNLNWDDMLDMHCGPHDVANTLLAYLTLLPEPVLPFDFYDRFCEPIEGIVVDEVDSEAEATIIQTYRDLVQSLPPLNRQLFLYLLDLLAVFASQSDLNKMTIRKLAAIFQPGLLAHPDHTFLHERRISSDVLCFLIERQDYFWMA